MFCEFNLFIAIALSHACCRSFAPEENPARLVDEWQVPPQLEIMCALCSNTRYSSLLSQYLCAHSLPLQTRILTWSYLVPINAFMLLVPHPLLCDWGHDTIPLIKSFADSRNLITFSFFILLVLIAYCLLQHVFRTRARFPAIFIGSCWTAITFLPASNLFFPVGFVIADRVLYTPSMGSCILLAHAATELYLKRRSQKSRFAKFVSLSLLLLLLLLPVAYFVRTWIR